MVILKEDDLDPGGRTDPISPNLLVSFAARRLLHNLYIYIFFALHPFAQESLRQVKIENFEDKRI